MKRKPNAAIIAILAEALPGASWRFDSARDAYSAAIPTTALRVTVADRHSSAASDAWSVTVSGRPVLVRCARAAANAMATPTAAAIREALVETLATLEHRADLDRKHYRKCREAVLAGKP